MNKLSGDDVLDKILAYGTAGILVLLPFHAFLTTWIGSLVGNVDAVRIWKEVIITLLVAVSSAVLMRRPGIAKSLLADRLLRLIAVYVLLHVLLGVFALMSGRVSLEALLYALLINGRFVVFFLVGHVAAQRSDFFKQHWRRLVLIPAAIVIIFGLVQLTLPIDFLSRFGYGPDTIPAYQTVDNKLEYQRIQSTLRGANPFGSYLLLILTMVAGLALTAQRKLAYVILGVLGGMALFFTYSRSAMLGLFASLLLVAAWHGRHKLSAKKLLIAGLVLLVTGGGLLYAFRDNDMVQNTVFHTDEHSQSAQSSNEARAQAFSKGVEDVVREPLGGGPGTAGPASVRNLGHPARIAENYYVQIAQEVGIVGLGVFLAISLLVARRLWQRRADVLSLALLGSLIGVSIINLFLHGWTDDTISLLWWGLAGVALASPALVGSPRR